jgi:hypothetical protein
MLEYKAILKDFAEFKNIPCDLEENVIKSQDSESPADGEPKFECELTTEYNGKPLQISLKGYTPEPMFRTYGLTADLEMFMNVGVIKSKEDSEKCFAQAESDFEEFFGDSASGKFDIATWKSEDLTEYAGLFLRAENVSLSGSYLEVLDYYLLRLYLGSSRLLLHCMGTINGWDKPGEYSYNSYVHEAARSADRIFMVDGKKYLESTLIPLDWSAPGISYDVPESIPKEYIRSEFLEQALWNGTEYLGIDDIRGKIFDVVAYKLSQEGEMYLDDQQMLWIVNHELITASSVYMSINDGLTLGSRGYFKVPTNAQPLAE